MQLSELIKDWPCEVKGSIRTEIEGIEEHVERLKDKQLFVMRKGKRFDAFKAINDVIEKGAAAIVIEDEKFFDESELDIPIIWGPNLSQFVAHASHTLCGKPSEVLKIVAITGTNGKTTVSHFVGQLLQAVNKKVMVIGTNGIYVNGKRYIDEDLESLTTLSAIQFHQVLRKAVKDEIQYVVLEASSIGLANYRLDFCDIDIGVFLNLSQDHLDEHGSAEQYKLAKQRLSFIANSLIFNRDDSFCRALNVVCRRPKSNFSLEEKADVTMQILSKNSEYTTCLIQSGNEYKVINIPFIFKHELYNVAAAITVMKKLDFQLEIILEACCQLKLPIGRLERFVLDSGTNIYVDYAHSPGAFLAVLQPIKELELYDKIIVVFSCGGNRDQTKRSEMGRIASKYADIIILTTDNCRDENPHKINEQIKQGFFALQHYEEILNREEAIRYAIGIAKPKDVVLVLGKGHETTQIIGKNTVYFSDRDIVAEYVSKS